MAMYCSTHWLCNVHWELGCGQCLPGFMARQVVVLVDSLEFVGLCVHSLTQVEQRQVAAGLHA